MARLLTALLAFVICLHSPDAHGGQERVRTIRPTATVPIPKSILPSDEVVLVEKWAILDYVDFGQETPFEEIARHVRDSDAVAILEVARAEPRLVDDGTWATTHVTSKVVEVIKKPQSFRGARYEFQMDCAVLKIGKAEVRAGDCPILERGGRYLVFLEEDDGRWPGYVFDVTDPRAVRRPRFSRTDRETAPNPFKGMTLAAALNEMRRSLGAPQRLRNVAVTAPIASLLKPDDQVVVLRKPELTITDYVYYGAETPLQELARHVEMNDGVAVVEVTAVQGRLIDHDQWIRTTVKATARNVFKGAELFSDNDTIELLFDGGVARIGSVEVRAGEYPIIEPGSRYLVFIQSNLTDRWIGLVFDVTDPLQVRRPRFANVDPAKVRNSWRGMSLAEFEVEILKALK